MQNHSKPNFCLIKCSVTLLPSSEKKTIHLYLMSVKIKQIASISRKRFSLFFLVAPFDTLLFFYFTSALNSCYSVLIITYDIIIKHQYFRFNVSFADNQRLNVNAQLKINQIVNIFVRTKKT